VHGRGCSLREIKELTDLRTRKIEACASVRDLLTQKLTELRAKLHELEKLESELVKELKKCDRELKHRKQHTACACPVLEQVQDR
jgi:DNA-binding transcriptional MerR regulator